MSDDARDPRTDWTGRPGPLLSLALIVGISPFATDMYIPGLPAIARDLDVSTAAVQLSLTAFLVAFAVGQLVVGPISDGVGRRRILIGGMALFTVSTVVCAIAPDIVTLVLARVVEGVGGAAAAVAGRAMVGDAATGLRRSKLFSTLAVVNSVGPVVAPLVGGVVLTVTSWRGTFVVLAVFGIVLTVAALRQLPETLVAPSPGGSSPRAVAGRMAELLRIPRFRWYLVTGCAATIGFFSYIATSSFVFQEQYGFSEGRYSLVFATNAGCSILSTLLFRHLVGRFSEDRLFTIGLVVGTVGSALVLLGAVSGLGAALVWPALALVTAAWGWVIPGSITLTQALGHRHPGTASALAGGLTFGLGGMATPLAGALGGTAIAMGALMTGFIAVGLAAQLWASAAEGRRGVGSR
ncbi:MULTISPECIES: multidrug effflux MFS transporter [unclassified Curtobacterium]|nr:MULTISPECIES: multidrug effflux MFS transporter [unclassified Curtobacterium]PZE34300.1 Bcr/CflA family drug resistance efflux transporter [Curtobacterium sp. MCPF17_031]PZF13865.1 Bcr/CflA family drug resistance efflux transporter [Curtobacterium sp. MCPF17_011]